jgi:hypothetical protein
MTRIDVATLTPKHVAPTVPNRYFPEVIEENKHSDARISEIYPLTEVFNSPILQ